MSDAVFNRFCSAMKKFNDGTIDTTSSEVVYGVITQIQPSLKVQIDNRTELSSSFFVVNQLLLNGLKVKIPHTHNYSGITDDGLSGSSSHTHTYSGETNDVKQEYVEINLFPPLKGGDRVVMFSFRKGQQYYIAEKVEGNDTTA